MCKDKTIINCRSAEIILLFHFGNIGYQVIQKVFAQQVISFGDQEEQEDQESCSTILVAIFFFFLSKVSHEDCLLFTLKPMSFSWKQGPDSIGCKAEFLLISLGLLGIFKLHLGRMLLY